MSTSDHSAAAPLEADRVDSDRVDSARAKPDRAKPDRAKPDRAVGSPKTPLEHAPAPTPVRFMTVAEVAATMRVSKMTVYRMVHSGDLAAIRVGRSFRVHQKAVDDYLDNAYIEAG